ncbi:MULTISPECIES: hypothetical protein [unclassified Sinorhizobium]|uniref:hypothetical protein n=1 Tax=unclassified Sinorhizobium TaxID=2613772 RepID=UPI0024C2F981|nr:MULTISPECIES: hypothetical protein [unclassified Sinorhizobium]MDK1376480.1 hypothetical protein [Sinorhizobium sp. 6-70]MDK1480972.1 hypothetical protein [Sinorhizobium sp. 6-117]
MHPADYERILTIEPELRPWLADAAARFRYLHPNVHLSMSEQSVTLVTSGDQMAAVVQDFMFCLYRQKIYSETLPLRTMLIEGVTGFAGRSA